LTALDVGVMRVRPGKDWLPIALMGGFAEVENNEVTILVNGAERGDAIDKAALSMPTPKLKNVSTKFKALKSTGTNSGDSSLQASTRSLSSGWWLDVIIKKAKEKA
jgi:F-type H+-transporting ATPase subunit epsilon